MCVCEDNWRQVDPQSPCGVEVTACQLPEWITESGGSVVDECLNGGVCTLHFDLEEFEEYWRNNTNDPNYPADLSGEFFTPDNITTGNITCECGEQWFGVNCEICTNNLQFHCIVNLVS